MAAAISKDRTIRALSEVWDSITELIARLPDAHWSTPSPLPGWDIQAVVAHIAGTEAMLLGMANPDVAIDRATHGHVRNDIGEANEIWVEHFRSMPVPDVRALFSGYTERRLESLQSMSQEEWDAESFTPAGKDTYGRFMQIRVFDCWLHEQDIRDSIGKPGHEEGLAVDVTLDELSTALGFVVGKRAEMQAGQSVTFELTHGAVIARTFHVLVGDRANVVNELDRRPTVSLTMPVGVMTRLCAGRIDPAEARDDVVIGGDHVIGSRLVSQLAYTV